MSMTTAELGGLKCWLVEPEERVVPVTVVLCHGYGAPGTDLVPIAAEVLAREQQLAGRVRFVFPEAPIAMDDFGVPGGRAWWPVDVAGLADAIEQGELRNLATAEPPEAGEARQYLLRLVDELQAPGPLVIGGFSQGSMLATDVALRTPAAPAALCVFSGTLLCEDLWRQLAAERTSLRVLQTHGLQDPLLPVQGARWLRELFEQAGLEVDYLEFPGMHSVPPVAIEKLAQLLCTLHS